MSHADQKQVTTVTCTEERARELVSTIRSAVTLARAALIEAYQTRAWIPLGHDSWQSLCDAEFDGVRVFPKAERPAIVAELHGAGMSIRAAGTALGVSKSAAHRASQVSQNGTPAPAPAPAPAPVVGLDGKTYEPPPKKVDIETFLRRDPEAAARIDAKRLKYRWSKAITGASDIPLLDPERLAAVIDSADLNIARATLRQATELLDRVAALRAAGPRLVKEN